jgi:ribonucleotide monophosphatase NagD (HAD superfamily)
MSDPNHGISHDDRIALLEKIVGRLHRQLIEIILIYNGKTLSEDDRAARLKALVKQVDPL